MVAAFTVAEGAGKSVIAANKGGKQNKAKSEMDL
jgi:hypothetical protein